MSLFSSTFSPVTLLQFDTRIFTAISLHEKITHWRTFCVLMFLLEVTGFLSCLASHILFQFFLLVQNSESVSSPVIIFANCLWLIMGIIFSNCSPDFFSYQFLVIAQCIRYLAEIFRTFKKRLNIKCTRDC